MNSIQVTPQNLRRIASQVDDKANEYYNKYQTLLREVDDLTSTDWKGTDATAFDAKVRDFEDDFAKMKALMNDYASYLRQAAQNYENTREANINTINALQS